MIVINDREVVACMKYSNWYTVLYVYFVGSCGIL